MYRRRIIRNSFTVKKVTQPNTFSKIRICSLIVKISAVTLLFLWLESYSPMKYNKKKYILYVFIINSL